jgi:hypothetical protein
MARSQSRLGALLLGVVLLGAGTLATTAALLALLRLDEIRWHSFLLALAALALPLLAGVRLAPWISGQTSRVSRAAAAVWVALALQAIVVAGVAWASASGARGIFAAGRRLIGALGQGGAGERGAASPSTRRADRPFGLARRVPGWPRTRGLAWEQDPATALRRALAEHKPLLVYVGSDGCPHCRAMETTGEWSDRGVIDAVRRVVLLAAHRWPEGDGAASELAVRLNVIAYPQLRYLDGWGRPLEVPAIRHAEQLRASVDRAIAALAARVPPVPLSIPDSLRRRVPADRLTMLSDPNPFMRAPAWIALLELGRLDESEALAALFGWESDAVVRLVILHRPGATTCRSPSTSCRSLLASGIVDANEWVRSRALELVGAAQVREHLGAVHALLGELEASGARFQNANNLRLAALRAVAGIADPSSIARLTSTARGVCGGGNACCRTLCEAAQAIWRRHRDRQVAGLLRAVLQAMPAELQGVSARDAALALAVLGEIEGRELAPRSQAPADLRRAIGEALR